MQFPRINYASGPPYSCALEQVECGVRFRRDFAKLPESPL